MFALSVAIDVNPPGAQPVLTQDDVWRALVMKAENALPFVPAMQRCEVLERTPDGLVREVVVRGERFIERITFTPKIQVLFERRDDAGKPAGWITNVISESEHGLALTFSFAVTGDASQMKDSYVSAVKATLAATRRLVLEGTPS